MAEDFKSRFEKLIETIRAKSISCLLLLNPSNIYYFTGFRGGGVLLVTSDGVATFYTWRPQGTRRNLSEMVDIVQPRRAGGDLAMYVLEELKDRRLTIGYDTLSAETYQKIVKYAQNLLLTPFNETIWEIRQPKSDEEIALLSKACEIAADAVETVKELISAGATVSELKRYVAEEILRSGAEGLAFTPSITVSEDLIYGVQSPVSRMLREGDTVSLKAGAIVEGYHSDISRTFYIGSNPPESLKKTYSKTLEVLAGLEDLSISWSPAVSVYEKVVSALKSADIEASYLDVIGHGIGLDLIEPPDISPASTDILRQGTVLSLGVEILVHEGMGFQFSDMYVVEGKKPRRISKLATELALG